MGERESERVAAMCRAYWLLAGWLPARPPRETERARERESEAIAAGWGVIMKPENIARASGLQENSKHVRYA